MIGSISGKLKAKAALVDPSRYGRSDRSPLGRWFWEIDRVLLLLVAVLIGIGLIAVAAASPAAGRALFGRRRCASPNFIISTASWSGSRSACR